LFADVPVEINYTGFLREFGQPVSGQRNVELKFIHKQLVEYQYGVAEL